MQSENDRLNFRSGVLNMFLGTSVVIFNKLLNIYPLYSGTVVNVVDRKET